MIWLPSASSVDMALACHGVGVLPTVYERSDDAEAGNVFHAFLDTSRKRGKGAALADAPEDEREWLDALPPIPDGFESEVALGWNPDTDEGKRYSLDGHRFYPKDGLFHGTADLVGVAGDRVVVGDWKRYGAKVSARRSGQLALLAIAACRVVGVDEAEVMMLSPGSRGWRIDRAVLDALDLAEWMDRLRRMADRLREHTPGRLPTLTTGSHCQYCPSLRYCPAQTAMVRHVAGFDLATMDERIAALSDVEAGDAWATVRNVEKIVEGAKKALQARARQAPIPLAGGMELREVRWSHSVKSETAKGEIKALCVDLEQRGEIVKAPSSQVRVVRRDE